MIQQGKLTKMVSVCSALLFSVFLAYPVFAADFSVTASSSKLGVGQDLVVTVNLDTLGEKANAVSGVVTFDPLLLSYKSFKLNSSAINFWLTEPKETVPGKIEFAGITPGGWVGESEIFSLVLSAKKAGRSNIDITDGSVLKNDGAGTSLPVSVKSLALSVQSSPVVGVGVSPIVDYVPPELFVIEIGRSPTLFDGKWFASFSAQDKQSGISYYEVQEVTGRVPDANKWVKTTSPYVLGDQNRSGYIFVKAVDFAGNERLSWVAPVAEPGVTIIYLLGVVILFVFCGIIYVLWRRRKVKK